MVACVAWGLHAVRFCVVGLDLAASGVGLDCGGRLVGALGRIRDGVGRWIGWGDGRLLYSFSF